MSLRSSTTAWGTTTWSTDERMALSTSSSSEEKTTRSVHLAMRPRSSVLATLVTAVDDVSTSKRVRLS